MNVDSDDLIELIRELKQRSAAVLELRRATSDFTEKNRLAAKEAAYDHAAELVQDVLYRTRSAAWSTT